MDTNDAMRSMIGAAGLSARRASLDMGRSAAWLSNTLARPGSSTAETLAELAEVCGYRLCAVPVDDVPPSALIIDAPREGQRAR